MQLSPWIAGFSTSWLSGHAAVGTLMGIVLADMVPERRAAIMARAREFAAAKAELRKVLGL